VFVFSFNVARLLIKPSSAMTGLIADDDDVRILLPFLPGHFGRLLDSDTQNLQDYRTKKSVIRVAHGNVRGNVHGIDNFVDFPICFG
jgi:hypothetical protein